MRALLCSSLILLVATGAGAAPQSPAQVTLSSQLPITTPIQTFAGQAVAGPVRAPTTTPYQAAPTSESSYRGDWRDWPLTPGDWVYRQDARGSIALFGARGEDALLTIRCDRIAGQVFLSRKGAAPGNAPMTVRTSSMLRPVSTQPTDGSLAYMAASLSGRNPLLDALGFSRGRFVIEQATLPILVIPAWAEILRVAEDCRR